jgi:hypothetical protein
MGFLMNMPIDIHQHAIPDFHASAMRKEGMKEIDGFPISKKIFPSLYAMEQRGHFKVPVIGAASSIIASKSAALKPVAQIGKI